MQHFSGNTVFEMHTFAQPSFHCNFQLLITFSYFGFGEVLRCVTYLAVVREVLRCGTYLAVSSKRGNQMCYLPGSSERCPQVNDLPGSDQRGTQVCVIYCTWK